MAAFQSNSHEGYSQQCNKKLLWGFKCNAMAKYWQFAVDVPCSAGSFVLTLIISIELRIIHDNHKLYFKQARRAFIIYVAINIECHIYYLIHEQRYA